ncbi:carboxypeptidase-like regulatory domain-containing protein [Dokdonia sp. Asnod3-C12]|uniref:carboxypeptidase-like regulatory domain-containing protein n=1 Tax=Dokdonia sp. Asnod3-C12 TaxID=3160575 RepID=UPI00386E72FA
MKVASCIVFFLFAITIHAQDVITGTLLATQDSLAIENASVYFNNTTIGAISNAQGDFKITRDNAIQTELIISVLGFETLIIPHNQLGSLGTLYLKESIDSLDEVILDDDTWSRERKMRAFKKHFIGSVLNTKDVKILNEKDIRLRYSATNGMLYADSNAPIRIRNKNLGYLVSYDLMDFEVTYEKSLNGFNMARKSFFVGTVFFENIKEKTSRKILKNRTAEYKGSLLHFLRALRDHKLVEEMYRVFLGKYETAPYAPFKIIATDKGHEVTLLEDDIQILYNQDEQSKLEATASFFIDSFGNHSPVDVLYTGGAMAARKVGAMLPLTFELAEE